MTLFVPPRMYGVVIGDHIVTDLTPSLGEAENLAYAMGGVVHAFALSHEGIAL